MQERNALPLPSLALRMKKSITNQKLVALVIFSFALFNVYYIYPFHRKEPVAASILVVMILLHRCRE